MIKASPRRPDDSTIRRFDDFGSVPQKKRQQLVHQFQHDPACRLFLSTNAGSTGLNLQAANTVINVDLPWNPAVLEQRIARAHRMGQKNLVQVFVLVTEGTIEEKLLGTLSAKYELALAALDMNSDVREVALASGMEELKRRLEVLLGAQPHAAVDESEKRRQQQEAERHEMIPQRQQTQGAARMANEFKAVSTNVSSATSRVGPGSRSLCRTKPRSTNSPARWPRCSPERRSNQTSAPPEIIRWFAGDRSNNQPPRASLPVRRPG